MSLLYAALATMPAAVGAPADACTLRGVVQVEPGSSASITASTDDPRDGPVLLATADEDGGFELAVPDAGPWRVSASAPGAVPAHTMARCDGAAIELALLPGDVSVEIAVKGEDMKPVANAVVVLSAVTKADVEPDPDVLAVPPGGLSFAVDRGPTFRVAAVAHDHGSDATEFVSDAADELRFQFFLPRLHQVRGVVRDSGGAPVANAVVACAPTEHEPTPTLTTTRADGSFELATDPHDEVTVIARTEGGVATATVDPDAPDAAPLTLVLAPGDTIEGHLVDEQNQRIAGRVHWRHVESGIQGDARADAGGGFVIAGIPVGGTVELWASDGAYDPVRVADDRRAVRVPYRPPEPLDAPVKKPGG
jgi:hypothetical protein